MSLITRYDEIVTEAAIGQGAPVNIGDVLAKASKENLRPAVEDGKRNLLLLIDYQRDFCDEKGSLTVYPGAKRDISNITKWIYNNMEGITDIYLTLDSHFPVQIFFPSFWRTATNQEVAPFTLIDYKSVQEGKFKSVHGNPKTVLDCLKTLETEGKGGVCIWPYHCLVGTPGHTLEHELAKMIAFHGIAKVSKANFIFKGTDTYSERYGVIEPCYNPQNTVEWSVLNAIADVGGGSGKINYDQIFIAGEASSHCVLESAAQILKRFAGQQEVLNRVVLLTDCCSPVSGFEKQAEDGLEALKKQYGIKLADSIDVSL
jgi:nicotinamidase-related amidase